MTTWNPKVGERVKYVAKSTRTGRLINVQGMVVTKITDAGFIAVDHRRMSKFKAHPEKSIAGEFVPKKFSGAMSRAHIEPISPEEWEKLPRTDMAGSTFARELLRAEQAEKADA